uniref:Putative ovule protein n=1 Tax=Solanum chacoense TaxID=4108 RepID=A0A0V0GR56_SOLCH
METKYANHFKKPYKPVGILKLPIQCHLGIYLCYFLNSLVYYLSVRITPESLETIQPSPKSFSEPTGAFKSRF